MQDPHPPAARRTVSEDEAKQYAAEKNCVYIEVSSTTGNKVESVFRNGMRLLLQLLITTISLQCANQLFLLKATP